VVALRWSDDAELHFLSPSLVESEGGEQKGEGSLLEPFHTVPQTAFPRPRQGGFAPCTPSFTGLTYVYAGGKNI
jgi:hypothetical protein